MTLFNLWKRRIAFDWNLRWSEWKSVVDLTTLLYLFIPFLLIAAYVYRIILASPPAWVCHIPCALPPALLLSRIITVFYNTHLTGKDLAFLVPGPWSARRFVFYSMALQWAAESFIAFFLVFLLFPFLMHLQSYNYTGAVLLGILVSIWQAMWLNVGFVLRNMGKYIFLPVKLSVPAIIAVLSMQGLVLPQHLLYEKTVWAFSIAGLAISVPPVLLKRRWNWHLLVEEADKKRISIISTLAAPPDKARKYIKRSVFPVIFSGLPGGFNTEKVSMILFIKMFLRSKEDLKVVLTMIAGSGFAIYFMENIPMRFFFLILSAFLLYHFFKNSQGDMGDRLWHRLAPLDRRWEKGIKRAVCLLTALFSMLLLVFILI